METLSFALGIAFAVVIATAIVAVYAFVKVSKLDKRIEQNEQQLNLEVEAVHRTIHDVQDTIYRDMNDRTSEIIRMIDSRMDKLEGKLTAKSTYTKQLLKD